MLEILDATCRVVARDGWGGLRMEAVGREAGVSKALVHYYFSTRRELLRAAFEHSENRANARLEVELALLETPAARLERFLLLDLDDDAVFVENRALWTEVCGGMRSDGGLRPRVEARYRAWVRQLTKLIDDAREGGALTSDDRAGDLALRLVALVDGIESILELGLIRAERARLLARDSIRSELGLYELEARAP
jgi:AcrR family transcriptional regulator